MFDAGNTIYAQFRAEGGESVEVIARVHHRSHCG
jgi:hypothetical protein